MNVGESFNPWRGACGFYAPDVIGRMRLLTDGQKRLYERLVRFAGKDGHCYPSQVSLATELGKTDRQVRKDLRRLEDLKMIGHQFRNGRRSNTYTFLWIEAFEFERNSGSGQDSVSDDLSGTPVPDNDVTERNSGSGQMKEQASASRDVSGFERNSRVDLSGTPVPTNSVQEFSTHNLAAVTRTRGASDWPRGGWEDSEDFERWWIQLVLGHPNKSRNGIAKTKAIELLMGGALNRAEFDEGYANVRSTTGERWLEQGGRFAPNLWQFLDDLAWKFSAPAMPPVPELPYGEDYLRRVENE